MEESFASSILFTGILFSSSPPPPPLHFLHPPLPPHPSSSSFSPSSSLAAFNYVIDIYRACSAQMKLHLSFSFMVPQGRNLCEFGPDSDKLRVFCSPTLLARNPPLPVLLSSVLHLPLLLGLAWRPPTWL